MADGNNFGRKKFHYLNTSLIETSHVHARKDRVVLLVRDADFRRNS
jgi:hypothetical protein